VRSCCDLGAAGASEVELARIVAAVHNAGRQVAVHAVSEEAVSAAVRAIGAAVRRRPRDDHRHRIEHCSQLSEGYAAEIARLGIVVVSQPSAHPDRGDRYLALVPEEQHRGSMLGAEPGRRAWLLRRTRQ
jgi:predicted amidohydrolase YtcJ